LSEKHSKTWISFADELQKKCREIKANEYEMIAWICESLKQIEKQDFDYYITIGKAPNFPDQKLDVNILRNGVIYGFTIRSSEKTFSISPVKDFKYYSETASEEFLSGFFFYCGGFFSISDTLPNSDKLKVFLRKLISAWGY